jgi:hypothetical protein
VEQLFEAAQGTGSLLFGVVGSVYLGLIVVLMVVVAITGVFASTSSRRKAALEVLRVLLIRRGTSSRDDPRDDHGAGGEP